MKVLTKFIQAVMLVTAVSMVLAAGSMITTGLTKIAEANLFGPDMIQQSGELPSFNYAENKVAIDTNKTNAIVRLMFKDDDDKDQFTCTAFVVSDTYALTAAHCIVDKAYFLRRDKIKIFDIANKDTKIVASPAAVNIRVDYGIVMGDFRKFNKILLDDSLEGFLGKSGPFASFGYPWGGDMMVAPLRLMPHLSKVFNMQVVGPIYPGMSGGPVLDLATGVAIGINHAVDESAGSLITPIVNFFDALDMKITKQGESDEINKINK